MIKNERQYRITKAEAQKFEAAISQLREEQRRGSTLHPLIQKAQVDALSSQLDDLSAEISEYEKLRAGDMDVRELESLEKLPHAIIKARIASGLTQKDLAERLGLKEQQIQRYEANEYMTASLSRLYEIAKILKMELGEASQLRDSDVSLTRLFNRLKTVGLDADFVLERLIPTRTQAYVQLPQGSGKSEHGIALLLSGILKRIFGWSTSDLFGDGSLDFSPIPAYTASFKMPSRTSERRLHAYIVYAHYLAMLTADVTKKLPLSKLPSDPEEFRNLLLSDYGEVNFVNVLKLMWSMGIPVLPLSDPGVFHGACWRIDRRNVIVLKQRTHSQARWLFDLLHEYWHVTQEPDKEHLSLIESDPASVDRRTSPEEEDASLFAGDVVLAGRAEEMAKLCVKEAKGKVELLKSVVPRVAERHKVPSDSLANYMAFRLSLQGINWWGTAENLQDHTSEPLKTASDLFFENCDFGILNETDRQLLACALEKFEE